VDIQLLGNSSINNHGHVNVTSNHRHQLKKFPALVLLRWNMVLGVGDVAYHDDPGLGTGTDIEPIME